MVNCTVYEQQEIKVIFMLKLRLFIISIMFTKCVIASQCHEPIDRQPGRSAAATETTNPGGSDAYQELNMMSRTEPVYNQLTLQ